MPSVPYRGKMPALDGAHHEPPGPPIPPPTEQLRQLGWPTDIAWACVQTTGPVDPDGCGSVRVVQSACPSYTVEAPLGATWAGYCWSDLVILEMQAGQWQRHILYRRLWLPGRDWYGVMEQHRGHRPDVSLRGQALDVRETEPQRLLALLQTLRRETRGRKTGILTYEDIQMAYWNWVDDLAGARPDHAWDKPRPSQSDLAAILSVGDPDTIGRTCKRDGRGWPPPRPQ
jgi:hypothetical protein